MSSDRDQLRSHFLGIVTTKVKYDQLQIPIGKRTGYIRQIAQAAGMTRRTTVLFSPDRMDWSRKRIRALVYRPQRGSSWSEEWCEIPQVIYNRIPTRSEERDIHFTRFIAYCRNHRIPVFNTSFFSKDQVYDGLKGKKSLRFVPETKNGVDFEYIQNSLIRYPTVFLKPVEGSTGSGIVRLCRKSNQEWNLEYGSKELYQNLQFADFSNLAKQLQFLVKPKHYVTQQGIQLKTVENRAVDFRVHLQRGKTGNWEAIAIGANVGGDRTFMTHVYNGGSVRPAIDVFNSWYGALAEARLQKFCDASIELATEIGQSIPFTLGELGIDIGIDQNERIWMFEANSKPGRDVFHHPGIRPSSILSARKVIEFADYLVAHPERSVHRL